MSYLLDTNAWIAYPQLKPEHIQAACQFGAAMIGMDESIYA